MSRPTIKDLEREFESGRGLYWDWFWDWKIKNEKAEKDILSTQLVKQSSNKLLTYLEVFSMFRNTNLKWKKEKEFTSILQSFGKTSHWTKLKSTQLTDIKSNETQKIISSSYKYIYEKLKDSDIRVTVTMISKIFMAVWGECPGLDKNFIEAYSEFDNDAYSTKTKYNGADEFTTFLKLMYLNLSSNKNLWEQLNKPIYCRCAKKSPIPIGRKIDLLFSGFWTRL